MELRGTLRDFSLADIIQLVAFGQKTGILRVVWPGGEASIHFVRGEVVHARSPNHMGEEAVYELFRVEDGQFEFHNSSEPPPQRTITVDATNLVMEAARVLDESRRAEPAEAEAPSLGEDFEDLQFEAPPLPPALDPGRCKKEIRELLRRRFGRRAKRLIKAVNRCGDSKEELLVLADRVEKYVRVFLDDSAAGDVAAQIRTLLEGGDGSSGG